MERIKIANLPTPIYKLNNFSKKFNKNIYIKRDDMTGIEFSGNKIRKLEYILAKALANKNDTLITAGGIQSNHARATAAICAMYNLNCELVLRGEEKDLEGNFWMNQMFGAKIHLIENHHSREEYMEKLAKKLIKKDKNPLIIPVGASNSVGSVGYEKAFYEIKEQENELGIKFDVIVVPVGSGGTYAGLLAGKIKTKSDMRIQGYAVDHDTKTFTEEVLKILNGMGIDTVNSTDININDLYKGIGYALSQDKELIFYKEISKSEGIIFDPCYTGKAFYGMTNELNKELRDYENILFIHTGGLYGWTKSDRERVIKL